MKLWNLLHGVPLTGEHFTEDMEISSLSYDTRTLEPGALFVALPGARTDGARFIREALEKGIPVRSEDELNQFLEDFLS